MQSLAHLFLFAIIVCLGSTVRIQGIAAQPVRGVDLLKRSDSGMSTIKEEDWNHLEPLSKVFSKLGPSREKMKCIYESTKHDIDLRLQLLIAMPAEDRHMDKVISLFNHFQKYFVRSTSIGGISDQNQFEYDQLSCCEKSKFKTLEADNEKMVDAALEGKKPDWSGWKNMTENIRKYIYDLDDAFPPTNFETFFQSALID